MQRIYSENFLFVLSLFSVEMLGNRIGGYNKQKFWCFPNIYIYIHNVAILSLILPSLADSWHCVQDDILESGKAWATYFSFLARLLGWS